MTRFMIAVLCLFASTSALAESISPDKLTELVASNVILGTETQGAFCSGTVIDTKKRIILTAAHCVAQQYRDETRDEVDPKTGEITQKKYRVAEDILVWQQKYFDYEVVSAQRLVAKVLAQNADTDQAIIQIRDPDYVPALSLKLASSDYKYTVSKPCIVIGNSFGIFDASVSPCTIASSQRTLRLGASEKKLVQLNSGAVGGNSGGAVIDAKTGELIGTLVAGIPGTTLTFMVPITISLEFIAKNTPK